VKATTIRSWNLNADDLDAAVDFYTNLLGAEVKNRHQVQGVDVARLDLGGFGLGLFDASGGDRPGVPHHTVGIEGPDDPEELKREIEAKGIAVDHIRLHGEREPGGYSLYVEDPSGNRIELSKSGN
jgi:catechol 2,3-dioxygenase-like lactoylglutathione lyase family enzyme